MSFSETIFLFLLALVIFGPKKLPEIARQVGKYLNEFKRASNEFKAQIEQEISHLEREDTRADMQKILPPNVEPAGAASRSLTPTAGDPLQTSSPAATLAASPNQVAAETQAISPETSTAGTQAGPAPDELPAASQESHA